MHRFSPNSSRPYGALSFVSLLELVVDAGDPAAHREFHNHRTPFKGRSDEPLRCAEFIAFLRAAELAGLSRRRAASDEIIESAYDLTIDKFSRLPGGNGRSGAGLTGKQETKGIDCRHYIRAFLDYYTACQSERASMGRIEGERVASRLLQRLVERHFALSLKEARRSANPFVSRYEWKVNGAAIHVIFPKEFPGQQRRVWLEENVENPDPHRPGEKERVQRIIDAGLHKRRFVRLEESETSPTSLSSSGRLDSWAFLYGFSVEGLATVVAEEKASQILLQRPVIRSIGSKRLRRMILEVFDSLESSDSSDWRIAERFGLSKASFSRFAGRRWRERFSEDPQARIPDLWLNTARALSNHPHFAEAAKEAGVWPRVTEVLNRDCAEGSSSDV